MQVREKPNIIKTKTEITSEELDISSNTFWSKVKANKTLILWLKLLLSLLICYFIFNKLLNKSELHNAYLLTLDSFQDSNSGGLYLLLFALLPLNWGLEAKKWQLLVQKIEPVSFTESYKAVLSGISLNMLTPFGLGDAISRTLFLKSKKRLEALGGIVINRVSQLLPTLLFGLISISYLLPEQSEQMNSIIITCLVLLLGLILFFLFKNKVSILIKSFANSKISLLTNAFEYYNFREILIVNILSVIRYVVFTLQFLIVFYIFKVELPFDVIWMGIAWIFLSKTIIPSLSVFTDLGIREASAIFYFGVWGVDLAQITAATVLLWCVNIIFPAIIGILFIPNLRFTWNPCDN